MHFFGNCARNIAVASALVGVSFLTMGCVQKPPIGTVRGVVKLRNKPLTFGTISMESATPGVGVSASIGPDGSYEIKTFEAAGLPPGNYKVAITSQAIAKGDAIVLVTDKAEPRLSGPEIPKKYQSSETSGLAIDVKAGENPPFDFDLK